MKFWEIQWSLDEILGKSWEIQWNLDEILENPDEILVKSWEIQWNLHEILAKSCEMETKSTTFQQNPAVSVWNFTLSGVSLSVDPSRYDGICWADSTGTERIFSDVIRIGIR